MSRQALGRGLRALLPQVEEAEGEEVLSIPVDAIRPNPHQPRREFPAEKLEELAASIREKGVLQPITVRRREGAFELVAGERRWRAARIAGLREIPAILRDLTDREVREIALIENLQREDLNPVEEAEAYEALMEDFGLTQEEVARAVGKGRPTVTNRLRLLRLPEEVRELVAAGRLSAGHAKALVSLPPERQIGLARRCVEEELSVRQLEEIVKRGKGHESGRRQRRKEEKRDPVVEEVEERLRGALGTKVRVKDRQGRGCIEVEYYSTEELNRILEIILGEGIDEKAAVQ